MNANQISIAIARFFGTRKNIIVPNISWGIGIHECDMLIITKAGYAIEVEIKTTKADVMQDKRKWHGHNSKKIKSLIFALPEDLERKDCIDLIPERAGIIIVHETNDYRLSCSVLRKAKINREAKRLSGDNILHVAKLGTMRMWNLKEQIERMPCWRR